MPFNFIAYAILLVVSTLLSYYFAAKKPEDKSKPSELDIPTCEQGTPYAIIFGRPPRFKSTMVLGYNGFRTYKWEDGDGAKGFYYYLGLHLGLSHAYIDGVKQLWFDDRVFWPVYNDVNEYQGDGATSFTINQFDAWGGKHGGGGLVLSGDILYGESDQLQNAILKELQDGNDTPYYRGITSIAFASSCYWSNQARLPSIGVVLKRTNLHHDGSQMWYVLKAKVDDYYSLNVVHVYRECLTSTIFGRGISTAMIDSTSWEAAADTCYLENIGISYRYIPDRAGAISDFLASLEEIMDGVVYYDHSDGLYKIKLIRDDYVEASLDVYDEDDFDIASFARPSYYQVPSETVVRYTDMDSARPASAKDDDLAIMRIQGETPITQTFEWPMIVNPETAAKLAAREQEQTSKTPAFLKLRANRSMYNLQRGDVIKITHPRLLKGGITSMVIRVVSFDKGGLENGEIYIDVTEEIFTTAVALTVPPLQGPAVVTPTTSVVIIEKISFSCSAASVAIINETA